MNKQKVHYNLGEFTVYKRISLLVGILLLGCGAVSIPSVAQAQTLVAQVNRAELKQMLEEGKRLVDAGDYSGAIAVYQRAAAMDNRNARIHSGIGYLYAQQGNLQAALAAYRRAIAIDPNNGDFFYAVGYIKGNMGDTRGAKEAYRRAIQLNRGHVNAYIGLGITQSRMGDYTAANWAFEQALSLDKNNAQTYEFMAAMYKQRRQTKQASNLLQKAKELYRRRNDLDGVARVEAMLQNLGG